MSLFAKFILILALILFFAASLWGVIEFHTIMEQKIRFVRSPLHTILGFGCFLMVIGSFFLCCMTAFEIAEYRPLKRSVA